MSDATEHVCQRAAAQQQLSKANVVGVAGGEDKLLVLVEEKVPLDQLAAEDVVDSVIEGIETDVIEVGHIRPMLKVGDSIGLHDAGTGTLGGLVVDENDVLYFLTNNHVAADSNRAAMLAAIHHPGPADGLGGQIGRLARFEPILFDEPNRIDAALVRVLPNSHVRAFSAKVPHPKTTTARMGWTVQKTGRTTGHNQGKVVARNATIDVDFGRQGVARFVNQLITTPMLWPGDSGSVLLSTSGHPVGLGFAGSSAVSIHTPINLVLRTLAVRFV